VTPKVRNWRLDARFLGLGFTKEVVVCEPRLTPEPPPQGWPEAGAPPGQQIRWCSMQALAQEGGVVPASWRE